MLNVEPWMLADVERERDEGNLGEGARIQIVIVVTFREADDALVFAPFREQFKGIERDEVLTVPKVIVLPTDAELVQQVEDDRVIEAPFSDVVGRVTARRAAAKVQAVRIGWAEQRAEVAWT